MTAGAGDAAEGAGAGVRAEVIEELFGREPRPVHRLFGQVCACGRWEAALLSGVDWISGGDVLDQWFDHVIDVRREEQESEACRACGGKGGQHVRGCAALDAPVAPPADSPVAPLGGWRVKG